MYNNSRPQFAIILILDIAATFILYAYCLHDEFARIHGMLSLGVDAIQSWH
jgi:hypothetical protein